MQELIIPGTLPGLNEILEARAGHRVRYNELKKAAQARVCAAIFAAELDHYPCGAHLSYHFVEPNENRDPGNIIAGGTKVIEDALVRTRVLLDDGWAGVLGYDSITWSVGEPRVIVRLR